MQFYFKVSEASIRIKHLLKKHIVHMKMATKGNLDGDHEETKGYGTWKPAVVWNNKVENTQLDKFSKMMEKKYKQKFNSYWDLHKWTVDNFETFWEEVWNYFDVIVSKPYEKMFERTGKEFFECNWLTGLTFNIAENILKIRDNRIALIFEDEAGSRETFTFSNMFEEVKRYAAALKINGLRKGDRFAYYMSNRKEALFAVIAALSIGAICGGPLPYHGPKAATRILNVLRPKILLAVDHSEADGEHYHSLKHLPAIAAGVETLEMIVVVATKKETRQNGISHISKSIFFEDFLKSGRSLDGTVPNLTFQQLPASHPTTINFTSGTTGVPKGVTHSAGAVIGQLRDYAFQLDLTSDDVMANASVFGWALWDYTLPSLMLGVMQFMFNGSPAFVREGDNIWNRLSRNRVSRMILPVAFVDEFQDAKIVPGPGVNLDRLTTICFVGSPPKPSNFDFILNHVKKDVLVCSVYGASEVFGTFTSIDFNMPVHSCECQVPSLGVDLKCYNEKGDSVVRFRGELVITTPTPSLPMCLWGDHNNEAMKEAYYKRFEGAFCQNDAGFVNPVTKGFCVIGRSDTSLQQYGERMSPSDIYNSIDHLPELQDFICVGQDRWDGESRAVLFVQLRKGHLFTPALRNKIYESIRVELGEESVPQVILPVKDIPYNLNHKRMETAVKKIVATNTIPQVSNIKNPESLQYYCNIQELLNYNI